MTDFNLEQIAQKMREKQSITEKLNYWKSVMDEYFNQPLTEQFGKNDYSIKTFNAKNELLSKLLGENYFVCTPMNIPHSIYTEHFEDGFNDPEYTYWFLKHNAQHHFEMLLEIENYSENLKTSLAKNVIEGTLEKLNSFEEEAEKFLRANPTLSIHNPDYGKLSQRLDRKWKYIKYLRIKTGYYKTHASWEACASGSDLIDLYAKHVYLKEFLENELKKALPHQLPTRLEQLFEFTSEYKKVMEILVSKKLIYRNTYYRNEKNCGKGFLCALIKDMGGKRYYKEEINMNYELCKEICKNTFKTEIKSNKTYYTELAANEENIIPFATTID